MSETRHQQLLTDLQDAVRRTEFLVTQACAGRTDWRERVRAGITAVLELFEEEPHTAWLFMVHSLAPDPRLLAYRRQVQLAILAAIYARREETFGLRLAPLQAPGELFGFVAETMVEGMLAVVRARLIEHDRRPLLELTSLLVSMAVAPLLGPELARIELERPSLPCGSYAQF